MDDFSILISMDIILLLFMLLWKIWPNEQARVEIAPFIDH